MIVQLCVGVVPQLPLIQPLNEYIYPSSVPVVYVTPVCQTVKVLPAIVICSQSFIIIDEGLTDQ